jgi:alpha-tubulin suppressor-like RCC1 family protein
MDSAAALEADGTLWLWGTRAGDAFGNATPGGPTPQKVTGLPPIKTVAIGGIHWVALDVNGDVWVWGLNDQGQLGLGDRAARTTPTKLTGLGNVVGIGVGQYNTYIVRADGSVLAWGWGQYGQLGQQLAESLWPISVPLPVQAASVAAGVGNHTCIVTTTHTAWCWGKDDYEQTANQGAPRHTPTLVRLEAGNAELQDVVSIAVGGSHTLARLADGTVWSWGAGEPAGQPGNTFMERPTLVAGLSSVGWISTGWATSFAQVLPDTVAPTGAIDAPATPVLLQMQHRMTGIAGDDNSGVSQVRMKFVDRQGVRATFQPLADLRCDASNRSCTWSTGLPPLGNYRVRAVITDYQGNTFSTRPVEFTVV